MISGDAGGQLPSDGGGGGMMPRDGGGGGFLSGDGGGGGGGFMPTDGSGAVSGGTVDGGTYTTYDGPKSIFQACCSFFVVIPLIVVLIFWNEMNLVKSDATAELVKKAHVVNDCQPTYSSNGRLVYSSCTVVAPDIAPELPAPLQPFFPTFKGASIEWEMEIYQWKETQHDDCQKNNDGSKTCHRTYSYSAEWCSDPVDDASFHSHYYSNVNNNVQTRFPDNLRAGDVTAPDHSVILQGSEGSSYYALPTTFAQMLPEHTLQPGNIPSGSERWTGSGQIFSEMLRVSGDYLTTAYGAPTIGDVRILLKGKFSDTASVAAKQVSYGSGFTFKEYPPQVFDFWGRKTYPLGRLTSGMESKKQFIADWHSENSGVAWIVRMICLIAMIAACCCLFSPISAMADLLRIINCFTCGLGTLLDNAAQAIIGLVSCCCGSCFFLFCVSLSWLFVHPTTSVAMMGVGILCFVALHFIKAQKGKGATARVTEGYAKLPGHPQATFKGRVVQPVALEA